MYAFMQKSMFNSNRDAIKTLKVRYNSSIKENVLIFEAHQRSSSTSEEAYIIFNLFIILDTQQP